MSRLQPGQWGFPQCVQLMCHLLPIHRTIARQNTPWPRRTRGPFASQPYTSVVITFSWQVYFISPPSMIHICACSTESRGQSDSWKVWGKIRDEIIFCTSMTFVTLHFKALDYYSYKNTCINLSLALKSLGRISMLLNSICSAEITLLKGIWGCSYNWRIKSQS